MTVKRRHIEDKPKHLLIKGGRIIDPSQQIDTIGDLFIANGKIGWLGAQQATGLPADCFVIQAQRMVVCPGFIDIHCHLRQPGFEDKETIATGTRAAARGGFTTICCMPNTNPPIDTPSLVQYVKDIAAKEGVVRVLPIGCITKGRQGSELAELGELATSDVVAFSDDGSPVAVSSVMHRAVEYSRKLRLPIVDHCEDLALSQDGVMNEGLIATRLRLKGIPAAAEESMVARDICLAKVTGGRVHIAHVSTASSVDLIRHAKEEGIPVSADVTPHHLTLTEEKVIGYNTNAKVNPPLRTAKDIEALIAGLKEGAIDIIATDHAPHTAADKMCPFVQAAFGISSFETALGSVMELVHRGDIDLTMLISKLTEKPAEFLHRADLGTLRPGSPADITIFDPHAEWIVSPEGFISRGKNTPLAGSVLKGKVMVTLFGGAIVFRDESIMIESARLKSGVSSG